ncbi:hypothetical protein MC885_010006, partial [Smutsia gigantea]
IKHSEEDQVLYPPLLPSKVDLWQVSIIPYNEWERIQDSLDSLTREAACLCAEKKAKKEMHIRSQDMVKHWTNTYAGMKEQKLEAKKKHDEEIEAERQILDVEEAIHKQGERKKSRLFVSRVIKERDAQIESQKKQEKAEKRHRDRVALANDHLKQIKEHKKEEERRRKHEEKDEILQKLRRKKREREKYEKNKAELKVIAEHRATVMKNKEEEERQRKIEDKEQLLAIMKADQIFREHEKEKKFKADKKHQEVQDAHIQQMAKNKFNAKEAKQALKHLWLKRRKNFRIMPEK